MSSNQRFFRKVFTGDRQMDTLQTNIEQAVTQPMKAEIINGRLAQNIVLTSGSNQISHKLNRKPYGYIVVDSDAAVSLYTMNKDDIFLTLNSSGAATVSLWIF